MSKGSYSDIGPIIGGIAVVALMLKMAWDVTIQNLSGDPFLCFTVLLGLSIISAVAIFNDAKTVICGGIVISVVTIAGYWLFDTSSLPLLIITLLLIDACGLHNKINTGRKSSS